MEGAIRKALTMKWRGAHVGSMRDGSLYLSA